MKTKASRKSHLPSKAPKRSGKRGPRPEAVSDENATVSEVTQPMLPTMEDSAIEEIESAAMRYADVRDRRMALTEQEVDANDLVKTLMHRHGKTHYKRGKVEIIIKATDEKCKVKIAKEED